MFARVSRSLLRQGPLSLASASQAARIGSRANSTLSIEVRGSGTGLAQTIASPPYTIVTDTYKTLGGTETAPSPLSYSLAGLAGCNQVTGGLVARDLGIKLGKWEVEVKGELDSAVLVKGSKEGHGNWDSVEVKIKVETDADPAKFELFRDETERRCPLSQLFIRSGVAWKNEWVNVKL